MKLNVSLPNLWSVSGVNVADALVFTLEASTEALDNLEQITVSLSIPPGQLNQDALKYFCNQALVHSNTPWRVTQVSLDKKGVPQLLLEPAGLIALSGLENKDTEQRLSSGDIDYTDYWTKRR